MATGVDNYRDNTGKLCYFEEQSLDEFYFIDLQWIFSTMMNITNIANSNGKKYCVATNP